MVDRFEVDVIERHQEMVVIVVCVLPWSKFHQVM
jgi:hypothetical protein